MKTQLRLSLLILVVSLFFTGTAYANEQSIVGKWKTISDETNEPESIVQIFKKQGKYYGKIIELFRKPDEDPNPVCDKCQDDDPRKDKPIAGMEIIRDMIMDGNTYKDGTITDPDDGKTYDCKLWLKDNKLMVRGYVAFLFRTQSWYRVE